MSRRRVIVHVDLDAFYASVEVRDDPSLKGKPVVVGGPSLRSVVCAASYEARKFGIHSAMPMSRAVKACPSLVIVRPRMSHYAAVSDQFFDVLHRYSPLVEGLSLDEAFLDLTGTEALLGTPMEAVARLRAEVRQVTGLASSAGIAPVKFAAKIVTDLAKPDGQREIRDGEIQSTLDPLPIGRLWGVGPKTETTLRNARIKTIGDLRRANAADLKWRTGFDPADLQRLANGEDSRDVVPDREAKSVGAEETFEDDLEDTEAIETYLLGQAERVASRLRRSQIAAGGVTLKYKLDDFTLVTRQSMLQRATNDGPTLYAAVRELLRKNPPPRPIRLVGLNAHALGPPPAPDLFQRTGGKTDRVNAALDAVREKFGSKALVRARLLGHDEHDDEKERSR